jgi:hypothetical protein
LKISDILADDDHQWGGSFNGSVELTPCTDGTFCCGHNNLTCCGTPWAILVPTQALTLPANITTTATAIVTETSSPGPGTAAVAGLGIGLGVVMLIAAGVIYYLKRQNKTLKQKNGDIVSASADATPPGGMSPDHPYRVSYMPSSGAPTMVAPSSHVPSMQEFAAFKAMYGNVIAYQNAQEMAGNPHRFSELDSTTIAAARHLSQVGSPPPPFDLIREDPSERRTDTPPPPPTTVTQPNAPPHSFGS